MDWRWLLLTLLCQIHIDQVENKEITAQINTKRIIQYVPDRFLSMTIDPSSIFIAGGLEQQAVNMARGLYPSFVRLGGKATNYLKFGKELFVDNNTITEDQWDGVNKFVQKAGLDLIVSLNPTHRVQGVWDSTDALQLISYSDKHGYSLSWQLGYDTEGQSLHGDEVARDIVRLRKILDGFQRYSKTLLFGPDIPDLQSTKEANYIRDILVQAGPVLGAIVVQLPFTTKDDPGTTLSNTLLKMDSHVWNKDLRFGRSLPKKPIWIAEKYPSSGSVEEAMNLLKHLGNAALIGCQIVLRQVGPETLKFPTPDYWLALLYKNLVGRGVFDARVNSGNRTEITLFSHCSQSLPQNKSILDTGFNYDKGAATVFGVNESPEVVKLTLRASMKDEKAHLYILTFQDGSNEETEKTFLNGQLMSLSPSGNLPIISPRIKRTIKYGINVPARSIFFIVLPDLKTKICQQTSPFVSPDVQSLSKKLIHINTDVLNKPANDDSRGDEDDSNKGYVKFTKTATLPRATSPEYAPSQDLEDSEPDVQVKYITFNDHSWLSKLTETMGNQKITEQHDRENENSQNDEEKYPILTAAITGSHNITDNSDSSTTNLETSAKKRKKRSTNEELQGTEMEIEASDPNSLASQEDLVQQLNQYASNLYKTSHSEENDKAIHITNIPPEIFNTLRNVKVTFKNLGADDPAKETENINTNEHSSQERMVEETKETPPTNDFLVHKDGTIEPIIIATEKSNAYPTRIKQQEFDIPNEENPQNYQRVPKEISAEEHTNLGDNTSDHESSDEDVNLVKNSEPLQDQEKDSITATKSQNKPSSDISGKSQEELQTEMEQTYNSEEILPSAHSTLNKEADSSMDTIAFDSELKKNEAREEQGNLKYVKLILPESTVSEERGLVDEEKESGINYVLKNIPTASSQDTALAPDTDILLLPVKSMEPTIIPNFVALPGDNRLQRTNELLVGENKKNNDNETSERNDVQYLTLNLNQNDGIHKNENEQEDTEKDSNPTEPMSLSQHYVKENDEEKINHNKNDYQGEQISTNEQFRTSENNQHTLEEGPPLPSLDSQSVKIQRGILLGGEMPENSVQNIPQDMVIASMVSELPSKDDSIDEKTGENLEISKENSEYINMDNINKNLLELSNNVRDRKDTPDITKEEPVPVENLIGSISPHSEAQVASFQNVPLQNIKDNSYEKAPDTLANDDNKENLSPVLGSQISLENIMEDQNIKSLSKAYSDKNLEIDQTIPKVLIPMYNPIVSPENTLEQLEKETYSSEPETLLPQSDSLPMGIPLGPRQKTELPADSEGEEKNNQFYQKINQELKDEKTLAQYKLLSKTVVPEEESSGSKRSDMVVVSKADAERERRERLQLLKKQILEMREQFRAQVREEGLKAAIQRREEEMKNYLNQDKDFKKKYIAYPLMSHDHTILSRPRRLSYYPESGISEEEQYDYLDSRACQKRADSYGMPIPDQYDRPYLHPQIISAPHNKPDQNHILFPLDQKTPQAVVYNDRIIPAKLYGLISVNEEPSVIKSTTIAKKPAVDLPIDSIYQKYYEKHYDPQPALKEKQSKISDSSLPLGTFSLPRDAYIKTMDESSNYIPIVVLTAPMKNNRKKRSLSENVTSDEKFLTEGINSLIQESNLKKRSIEASNGFLERSYDFLNEIPNGKDNRINSVEYEHPNEIVIQKRNEIEVDKFPKRYPEFLPNNVPLGYLPSRPNLYNGPPMWNDAKLTNNVESRSFLTPQQPSVIVRNSFDGQQPTEKHACTPKSSFWSTMKEKLKTMLEIMQSLSEWYSSSSDK